MAFCSSDYRSPAYCSYRSVTRNQASSNRTTAGTNLNVKSPEATKSNDVGNGFPCPALLNDRIRSEDVAIPVHDQRRTDSTLSPMHPHVIPLEPEVSRTHSAPVMMSLQQGPVSTLPAGNKCVASNAKTKVVELVLRQVQAFTQGIVNLSSTERSLGVCRIILDLEEFELLTTRLPERIKYTYTSSDRTLIIHQLPTNYHEVGPLMLHLLSSRFSEDNPTHNSHSLSELSSQIVWSNGSPSIRNNSIPGRSVVERVPDASVGMPDRVYPTVVVEVGYSQKLRSLRTAARSWLEMIDGEDRIELVILIEYTQRNTINAEDTDTGAERDHTYPETTDQGEEEAAEPGNQDYTAAFGNVSPVYLEVWRSCPDSGCRAGNDRNVAQLLGRSTRSSTRTASPAPHMCQRFKIYPAATSSQKQVTFLLTDFVGSDVLEDAPGLLRWEVPISLFSNAVHLKRTIAEAHSGVPRKKKLRAGEILMEEQEIVKENVMGLARGGVLREVSAQETQQTQKRRRVA